MNINIILLLLLMPVAAQAVDTIGLCPMNWVSGCAGRVCHAGVYPVFSAAGLSLAVHMITPFHYSRVNTDIRAR